MYVYTRQKYSRNRATIYVSILELRCTLLGTPTSTQIPEKINFKISLQTVTYFIDKRDKLDNKNPNAAELYMLFVARQYNATENDRLIVVSFQNHVGLLSLNADCLISDAIVQMQKMFGITNKFTQTLVNLGCISQSSEIIKAAKKISQIKFDRSNGPKVIRLALI